MSVVQGPPLWAPLSHRWGLGHPLAPDVPCLPEKGLGIRDPLAHRDPIARPDPPTSTTAARLQDKRPQMQDGQLSLHFRRTMNTLVQVCPNMARGILMPSVLVYLKLITGCPVYTC